MNKICLRCWHSFILKKWSIANYCSRSCANKRKQSEETKKLIKINSAIWTERAKVYKTCWRCFIDKKMYKHQIYCDDCKYIEYSCLNCNHVIRKEYSSYIYRKSYFCSTHCFVEWSKKWLWEYTKFFESNNKRSETRKKLIKSWVLTPKGWTTKWYNYWDIRIQWTYELRACYILDEMMKFNEIDFWEYSNDRFQYMWLDNKEHTYIVDFKVSIKWIFYYLEVKGWFKDNDKHKMNEIINNGINIIMWFKKDLEYYENKFNIRK